MSYYPPEWDDEDRIRVLLSPMPKDEVAKKSRITFWTSAIHNWSLVTNSYVFSVQDVCDAFTKGTNNPKCMNDIILHLVSNGDVCDANNLPKLCNTNESWVTWGRRVFVSMPSKWAWDQMKQMLGSNKLNTIQIANVKILNEKSNEVFNSFWKYKLMNEREDEESVLSLLQLFHIVSDSVGTVDNLQLIVEFLANQNRAKIITHKNTTLIKLAKPGIQQKPEISERDIAHFQLSLSKCNLEREINSLLTESTNLQLQAKQAVKSGIRRQALSALRRKKQVESTLIKLNGTLENVTACQLQLREADINKQVVQTFHSSVCALKTLLSGELSGDEVASTMDTIQELLEESEDTSSIITGSFTSTNDDELEEELEEILNDKQTIPNEEYKTSYELPDVPESIPEILQNLHISRDDVQLN